MELETSQHERPSQMNTKSKQHRHRALNALSVTRGFAGCVNPDNPNPRAHGNIVIYETCRCGAKRAMNVNFNQTETSRWKE